jgi:cell division transport system permease protein
MKNALTGVERALFWTLAFAVFAAVSAGLAARAVDRLAANYEEQRRNYAIVRVVAPEGPEGLAAAEAALAQSPYVSSAAPMTAGRAAAILGQWGGNDIRAEDLPPLRLIEIELANTSEGTDLSGDIVAALAQGGVTAEVIEAPDAASGGGVASRVRLVAYGGAGAFALVMAIIVSLAARSLAARRRELVTVMTDLGATRGQAAGRIADEAAILGLYAGLAGALLAGLAGIAIMLLAVPGVSFESLPGMIALFDLAPVAAAPVVAAIAAGLGARAAAGYFHGQASRLG